MVRSPSKDIVRAHSVAGVVLLYHSRLQVAILERDFSLKIGFVVQISQCCGGRDSILA